MAHDDHKSDPRHVRAFHISSNKIGGSCISDDQSQTGPEVEQANEVEHSHGDNEPVLQLWVVVWQTLEDTSQGI